MIEDTGDPTQESSYMRSQKISKKYAKPHPAQKTKNNKKNRNRAGPGKTSLYQRRMTKGWGRLFPIKNVADVFRKGKTFLTGL